MEFRVVKKGEARELQGIEREIYRILRKLRVPFDSLVFTYGTRGKLWTLRVNMPDLKLEIPLYQFSLTNPEKLEKELKMLFDSIKIISRGGILVSVRPVLRYVHLVPDYKRAKRLATCWLRKAMTHGLEVSVDYEPLLLISKNLIPALEKYATTKGSFTVYKIPSINVQIGFWSYDVLVGAVGSIIVAEDDERKAILELLNGSRHSGGT